MEVLLAPLCFPLFLIFAYWCYCCIFEFSEKQKQENKNRYEAMLSDAIKSHERLSLKYRKKSGEKSERIIVPIELYSRNGTGYIRAMCLRAHEERTFRVDRIIALAPVGSTSNSEQHLDLVDDKPKS